MSFSVLSLMPKRQTGVLTNNSDFTLRLIHVHYCAMSKPRTRCIHESGLKEKQLASVNISDKHSDSVFSEHASFLYTRILNRYRVKTTEREGKFKKSPELPHYIFTVECDFQ